MQVSKFLLLVYLFLFTHFTLSAQSLNTDSIDNLLKTLKDDTAKVNLLIKTARKQIQILPETALNYSQQALSISKKISYTLGIADAYFLLGIYYSGCEMNIELANKYLQFADSIYKNNKGKEFRKGEASILHSYGNIELRKANYLNALQFYLDAAKIFEQIDDKERLARTYYNLAIIYSMYWQTDKAEYYYKQCMELSGTISEFMVSASYIGFASILMQQKKYEEAFSYIEKAIIIAEKNNNYFVLMTCYQNKGIYFGEYKKNYKQATDCLLKAEELAKKVKDKYEEGKIIANLSNYYGLNGQTGESKKAGIKAYNLAIKYNLKELIHYSLLYLAISEAKSGNYKNAYGNLLKSYFYKDTVQIEENKQNINYYEASFQKEKKENEILQLKSEKEISELALRKRKFLIYSLIALLMLLLFIFFLWYKNIRNKRLIVKKENEIQKHKITQLEKEKILLATQSVLKGEELERKRIARDLHDGLGGLLTGLKLKFKSMRGNVILSKESVNDYSNALELLDKSISELRRIAHNMMPESLVKLGLKDALNDLCESIKASGQINVNFQFIGNFKRIDQQIEMNAFRIVQEFTNNSIKHSGAKDLLVQMVQEEKRLGLIIQDNGCGFDVEQAKKGKGIGINNIISRVETMKGDIDIFSKIGEGTEININIPL